MRSFETSKCRDARYYRAPTTRIFKNKSFVDYKNFNINRPTTTKNKVRCGVIVFDPTFEYIVCVVNNYIWKKEKKEVLGLPKGHINEKETFYNCAKRELNEETGLNMPTTPRKMLYLRINNTYYYPIILSKDVVLNPKDKKEIYKAEWYLIEDLKNKNKNRDLKMLTRFKFRAKTLAKKNIVCL